jgi:hypothetical protein
MVTIFDGAVVKLIGGLPVTGSRVPDREREPELDWAV